MRGETHSNLIGQKFGMLIPFEYVIGSKWKCRCDCGNETVVSTSKLTSCHTKSCGCLKTKGYHFTHKLGKPDTYSHWYNIKSRCFNKNHPRYSDWGGRGITMCDEWKDNFKAFHEYVTNLPNYGKRVLHLLTELIMMEIMNLEISDGQRLKCKITIKEGGDVNETIPTSN